MKIQHSIFNPDNYRDQYSVFNFVVACIINFFFSFSLLAQSVTQSAPYEREHKNRDHEFIILSLGEKGLALVRDTEKFEGNKKKWEVILIDSTLNESWTTTIEVEQRMNILGHDYRDGNIYLIFQEPETAGRLINLTELIFADHSIRQHEFKPEVNIKFTQFSVTKHKAIFGGYINKEPALLMYDMITESARVVPGIFQPNVELLDVRTNSNDTFNALLVDRNSRANKKLVIRTFDSDGVLLVDDVIVLEDGKSILEAMTSSLVHDELVIMGTWTYTANKQAAGIFSVVVDPFNEQKVNYYDLPLLTHFLDYLKPKRAAKIKAKAEWRKSVGKPIEFRTYLSAIKIEETKDGFAFLTESYETSVNYNSRWGSPYSYPYSPYSYSPYGFSPYPYRYSSYGSPYGYNPYGPYGTSYSNSSDLRVIHSSLIFFDGQGRLVSDCSLKYEEIKLDSKSQVSDFIIHDGFTTMACKNEKEIIIKVTEHDGAVVKEEKIKPELKKLSETVRSESQDNSSIRTWYGRYFYVYGYRTVHDNSEKSTRHVFYINKIKVG